MRKAGADAIVTVCPACHMQFDLVAGARLRAMLFQQYTTHNF